MECLSIILRFTTIQRKLFAEVLFPVVLHPIYALCIQGNDWLWHLIYIALSHNIANQYLGYKLHHPISDGEDRVFM